MKIKEKAKRFWEEHGDKVTFVVASLFSAGICYGVYKCGYNQAVKDGDLGLGIVFVKNPELKTMMEATLKEIEETGIV